MDKSPVPIRFELPSADWRPVDAEALGVTNALFFAARTGPEGDTSDLDGFTPTLSVSGGWRADGASMTAIADESVAKLRAEGADEVELVRRRVVDSDTAPAVSQTIGAVATIDGQRYDLRQTQAVFGYVDLEHPDRVAVLVHTLTHTFKQEPEMVEEFRAYLESIEVAPGEDPGAAPTTDPSEGA
ncbi:MAG: hypothetical protein WB767_13140 [Nocardioides sp.]